MAALENQHLESIKIVGLHSGSTDEEKEEVEKEAPAGVKRIIIATNFAETGITIPGLSTVINTGEEFERTVDQASGLEYVRRINQARAGCDQRSGRVGRTSPGVVYNLFTQDNYNNRQLYPTPEIQRTDLTNYILRMKRRGMLKGTELPMLSSPIETRRLEFASEALNRLGALNTDGTLNHIGERMADLPTEFHLARMIAEAEGKGRGVEEVCTIAAFVEARPLLGDSQTIQNTIAKFRNPNSDFLTYLTIWQKFEENGRAEEWARQNNLDHQSLMKASAARNKLLERTRANRYPRATPEEVEQFIFAGYKDRLMQYDPVKQSYQWIRNTPSDIHLRIDKKSALEGTKPQYIISGSNTAAEAGRQYIYVSNCQRVKPEWLTT